MHDALKGKPLDNVPQPPNIVSVRINPDNGHLARPGERNAIFVLFRKQFAPSADTSSATSDDDSAAADTLEQQIY